MNRTHLAGLGAGLAFLLLSASAYSQTIVIDPGCGTCAVTLEQAVGMTNGGLGDRIEWAPDVAQIEAPSATLDIVRNVTIVANGAFHPIVTWGLPAGQPLFRVGNSGVATSLRLEHVVLAGNEGDPAEDNRAIDVTAQGHVELVASSQVAGFRTLGSGVIRNRGELVIEDSQIYGNFAHDSGGAILQESKLLSIVRTSIYNNRARIRAGGIMFDGQLTPNCFGEIFQSSLFSNVAGGNGLGLGSHPGWTWRNGIGGGIVAQQAHFYAENTTLSRNIAESDGPINGIASNLYVSNAGTPGGTELRHVTLAEGGAPGVNGVVVQSNNMAIYGSIIHAAQGGALACNISPPISGDDVVASDSSCAILGANINYTDPMVAPLAIPSTGVAGAIYSPPFHPTTYFGPALDTSGCYALEDQRGVSRPQRSGCDIGAHELEPLGNATSLEFDGIDDYVDMGDPIDMSGLPYMTLSWWMKVENSWQTLRYVMSRLTPGQKQFAVQTASLGRLRLTIAKNLAHHISVDTVGQPITLNTWHHVAMVYDGTLPQADRLRLYVDGLPQALGTPSCTQAPCLYPANLTHPSGPSPVRLGASSATPNWYFTGKLDEVAVFDGTAMSAGEVTALYGTGSADDLSGYGFALSHWWRFDGDVLPTVADHDGLAPGTMVQMEAGDFNGDAP